VGAGQPERQEVGHRERLGHEGPVLYHQVSKNGLGFCCMYYVMWFQTSGQRLGLEGPVLNNKVGELV
jgi:hypothetical protein